MSRVLIVSADSVGERMAGPGVRAWELGMQLAGEHEVTVMAVAPAPTSPPFNYRELSRSALLSELPRQSVIIVQGSAHDALDSLVCAPCPVVIDLYDPYPIESLEMHSAASPAVRQEALAQDLRALRVQCAIGDLFLCASGRQRHFWLGVLAAAGRLNAMTYAGDPEFHRLLAVVPFGLPTTPPAHRQPALRGVVEGINADDRIVLWAGGIWNWFDPGSLIRAVAALSQDHPNLKLVFMSAGHPNPSVPRMKVATDAQALARDLGLVSRQVFFLPGWVPYAERENYLAEADIGASLHLRNIETEFAWRTRVFDYLWAGLPMLLTEGDLMASLAAERGFGPVVPAGDVEAVTAGLRRMLEDEDYLAACRAAVSAAAPSFRWSQAAQPLLSFCRNPTRSPGSRRGRGVLDDAGRKPAPLHKAWASLRKDGLAAFGRRTERYLRRRRG